MNKFSSKVFQSLIDLEATVYNVFKVIFIYGRAKRWYVLFKTRFWRTVQLCRPFQVGIEGQQSKLGVEKVYLTFFEFVPPSIKVSIKALQFYSKPFNDNLTCICGITCISLPIKTSLNVKTLYTTNLLKSKTQEFILKSMKFLYSSYKISLKLGGAVVAVRSPRNKLYILSFASSCCITLQLIQIVHFPSSFSTVYSLFVQTPYYNYNATCRQQF